MVRLQKVGRSGTEPAEVHTFDYAGINEEDHVGWPCGTHGREKKNFAQNFRQKS